MRPRRRPVVLLPSFSASTRSLCPKMQVVLSVLHWHGRPEDKHGPQFTLSEHAGVANALWVEGGNCGAASAQQKGAGRINAADQQV